MSRLPWALCVLAAAAGCSDDPPIFVDAAPSPDAPVAARCGDGIRTAGEVCFEANPQRLVTENPPNDAQAADLDGDGDLDVFYVAGGEFRFHLNTGGVFPAAFTVGFASEGGQLVARDLDGDSRADVAISAYNELSFWRSNGTPPITHQNTGVISTQEGLRSLELVDLDGDGRPEMMLGLRDAFLEYVDLLPDLTLHGTKGLDLPAEQRGIAAGRFDAVAGDDLVIASAGGLAFLPGTDYQPVATGLEMVLRGVAPGDADGDGHLDAYVLGDDAVGVALGRGDGTFAPPTLRDLGGVLDLSAGDLDGDGLADLAVASNTGTISVLLGQGTLLIDVAAVGGWFDSIHVVGDLDGDGAPDVVCSDGEGEIVTILLSDP